MACARRRCSCSAPFTRTRHRKTAMGTSLAQVLRHFGQAYLHAQQLSTAQAKAWRAIVNCRTEALGGQLLQCDGCGAQQWRWHSCRNRHCPQCQARRRDAWLSARMGELLDVPYCHLVFTLPHELNALSAVHARWVYDSVAEVLEHEGAHLMPMTAAFDGYVERPARVSSTCLVSVVKNRYSVPCELAGQMVSTRLYPTRVRVKIQPAPTMDHQPAVACASRSRAR